MTTASAFEQLTLELINRFRIDPAGEYERLIDEAGNAVQSNIRSALSYFGVDIAALEAQLATGSPVAPLAWSEELALAAERHSELMIAYDQQSHRVQDENGNYVEPGLGDRITDVGYSNWRGLAENVFAYAEDALYSHAGFVIDWGYDAEDFNVGSLYGDWRERGDGIQDPAGHRINLLSATYTEVGISALADNSGATEVGPYVVTQDFGTRAGYDPQVLGVVINDLDGDLFYDIGEGLGGVIVTVSNANGTYSTTTGDAGGYQLEVPAGSYDITFSGAALGGEVTKLVTISGQNVKIDARADEAEGIALEPSTGNDDLVGTAAAELVRLLAGHDIYDALGGDDTVYGGNGRDTIIGGDGADLIVGGSGADLLIGDQNSGGAVSASSPAADLPPAPLALTSPEALFEPGYDDSAVMGIDPLLA